MRQSKFFLYSATLALILSIPACQGEQKKDGKLRADLNRKKERMDRLRSEIDSIQRRLARSDSGKAGKGRKVLVRTKVIRPIHFEHRFSVNGAVKADQEVLLSAERQGTLEAIMVEEGDRVEKGELIARQNQTILRTRLKEIETRYQHARTLYEKQKRLWKDKGIGSELDYLNAKNKMETLLQQKRSLEEELDMTRIKSPISGTIEELRLKEGAYASPASPIAHIVGIEKLFVEADLSERYLPKVQEGDSVMVSFPVLGISMKRPIQSLGNRIDPQDRTFEARVKVRNTEDRAIKPNLSAELLFTDFQTDSAMVIPSGVLQSDPKGDHIYVVSDSDTARKRYIELGPSQSGRSLVEKGLEYGERVVIAGQSELSDGMAVREEDEEKAMASKTKKREQ